MCVWIGSVFLLFKSWRCREEQCGNTKLHFLFGSLKCMFLFVCFVNCINQKYFKNQVKIRAKMVIAHLLTGQILLPLYTCLAELCRDLTPGPLTYTAHPMKLYRVFGGSSLRANLNPTLSFSVPWPLILQKLEVCYYMTLTGISNVILFKGESWLCVVSGIKLFWC